MSHFVLVQDVMHEFVDENKEDAFNDAAAVVTTGLSEAATSIETKLNDALAELSLTVRTVIAPTMGCAH